MISILVTQLSLVPATRTQDIGRFFTCKPSHSVNPGDRLQACSSDGRRVVGQVTEIQGDGTVVLDTMQ